MRWKSSENVEGVKDVRVEERGGQELARRAGGGEQVETGVIYSNCDRSKVTNVIN